MEGIVGTYMANQKVPGSRYGASVISYDKGGEWVRLIPPAIDSSGRPTICAPVRLLIYTLISRTQFLTTSVAINFYQHISQKFQV